VCHKEELFDRGLLLNGSSYLSLLLSIVVLLKKDFPGTDKGATQQREDFLSVWRE
jgi:hypothetical protein